jgi:hypothetical protein
MTLHLHFSENRVIPDRNHPPELTSQKKICQGQSGSVESQTQLIVVLSCTVGSNNLMNFLPQAVSVHSFRNFKML